MRSAPADLRRRGGRTDKLGEETFLSREGRRLCREISKDDLKRGL